MREFSLVTCQTLIKSLFTKKLILKFYASDPRGRKESTKQSGTKSESFLRKYFIADIPIFLNNQNQI